LEEQLCALKDLLAGKRVTIEGRYVTLREAEIFSTAPPPPLWVAGKRPRMLRLTARHADGWNLAWGGADPAWMREVLAQLRAELESAGRDPKTFTTSIGVSVPPGTPESEIAEMARAYEATGIDLLILSYSAQPGGPVDPEGMERGARALGLG
jgi:alkanesulfonate monooxygenase SsuD/methylene tetrahydromethanopterin reductase-like flavin-dependent oxidoreductase (luciferase family)